MRLEEDELQVVLERAVKKAGYNLTSGVRDILSELVSELLEGDGQDEDEDTEYDSEVEYFGDMDELSSDEE